MNTAAIHSPVHSPERVNNGKIHSENVKKAHTHKEVFDKLLDRLSVHYDVDMHKLVKL